MASLRWSIGSSEFQLSPPISGWGLFGSFALLLVALLALSGLFYRLYRYELRWLPPRIARSVLMLRLTVLAILVILLGLQPMYNRTVETVVPGQIVIGCDVSESLEITDSHRTLAEKLELARALKLTPTLATDRELDRWIESARSVSATAATTIEADAPTRQRLEKILQYFDTVTRSYLLQAVLHEQQGQLISDLQRRYRLQLLGFDQSLFSLPMESVTRQQWFSRRLQVAEDQKQERWTDLKIPLAQASQPISDNAKTLGVILLTDGRHNWGGSPQNLATTLRSEGVPIYPVILTPKKSPRDLAITEAKAQSTTVFAGSAVPIEVDVRATNWPPGKVVVQLQGPADAMTENGKPREEIIQHDGNDQTYPLSFRVKMPTVGVQSLQVQVQSQVQEDRFLENNQRTIRVNVVQDRAKVLLLDGEARWEFHYLQTCLGRDPNMEVRSVVFRQPRITDATDAELIKFGIPALQLPTDPETLAQYDVIVLGNTQPKDLPLPIRELLEKYVGDSGGTLVIQAGKNGMPTEFSAAPTEPLRKLLPLQETKVWKSNSGSVMGLTPSGQQAWFLQLGDTPAQSRQVWQKLPRHYWGVTGELKAGADVLATLDSQPMIVKQNYGFGRVLFVGIDSTWRWRFRAGDIHHHKFWGQIAQWAASDRLLPTANATGTIRFGTREPQYLMNQPIECIVRGSSELTPLNQSSFKGIRIMRISRVPTELAELVQALPLEAIAGRALEYRTEFRDLPPGSYAIELDIPDWKEQLRGPTGPDGRAMPLRSTFDVLPPVNEEFADVSGNRELLEQLATETGGRVFELTEIPQLLETLQARPATITERVQWPFRQSWLILILLLLLIVSEWALRKWAGLP